MQTDRQTDRPTDRQTERQTDRTDRPTFFCIPLTLLYNRDIDSSFRERSEFQNSDGAISNLADPIFSISCVPCPTRQPESPKENSPKGERPNQNSNCVSNMYQVYK